MNLGGLEHLPGCRQLLIRKHTVELERVMRLWRALVQQMRGQVTEYKLLAIRMAYFHQMGGRAVTVTKSSKVEYAVRIWFCLLP